MLMFRTQMCALQYVIVRHSQYYRSERDKVCSEPNDAAAEISISILCELNSPIKLSRSVVDVSARRSKSSAHSWHISKRSNLFTFVAARQEKYGARYLPCCEINWSIYNMWHNIASQRSNHCKSNNIRLFLRGREREIAKNIIII